MEERDDFGSWGKGFYMDPIGKTFSAVIGSSGETMVIERWREHIDEPVKTRVLVGKNIRYMVKKVELQTRDICRHLHHEYKKLGAVNWRPDIDLFLRALDIIFKDVFEGEGKDLILQRWGKNLVEMLDKREAFFTDRKEVFLFKPDELLTEPLMYVFYSRPNREERLFFQGFIEENIKDKTGVLLLRVTFDFLIE